MTHYTSAAGSTIGICIPNAVTLRMLVDDAMPDGGGGKLMSVSTRKYMEHQGKHGCPIAFGMCTLKNGLGVKLAST